MKLTQNLQMGMQNKVKYMKKLFQNPNIYKKKKSSNETSSPNIILLRQTSPNTNCDLFLPSARQRQTYTHNEIQTYRVQKDKKKKENLEREGTRSCYRTFPRPTFSFARRKLRALSSFLDSWNEYSRFPQVRSMPALEIDYIGHALRYVETVETRNAINHLLPGRVRPTFAAKNLRQENWNIHLWHTF